MRGYAGGVERKQWLLAHEGVLLAVHHEHRGSRYRGPGGARRGGLEAIAAGLDATGCAVTPQLLAQAQCGELAALYDQPDRFRATIDMARHRFGSGQYRYFSHDLPGPVRALREAFYPHLLVIARDWASRLGLPAPGRTPWLNGWACAIRPGSPKARRSCCATGRRLERTAS